MSGGPSQADVLVSLALTNGAELWHAPDRTAYATVQAADHRETHAIRSRTCRSWLLAQYYANIRGAPNANAVASALNVLEGIAVYGGPEYPVYLRLAEHDGRIYLDLGGSDWSSVQIAADGWTVVPRPPVRFRRGRAMLPLPIPERGGSLDTLRLFVNVETDADFRLLLSVLVSYMRPRGPYPLLVLQGEQGSAKSTAARVLKGMIDPAKATLRTRPRDEGDLIISATHAHVLAFDNLSSMPDYLSDGLCRLATGGGLAKRELYTDSDEVVLEAVRPVIINGIADVVVRDDLRDRAVAFSLPRITAHRDEQRFWSEFEAAQPRLLGALLDAVSIALARVATVDPTPMRMADFSRWACAAAPALGWTAPDFLTAYTRNRFEAATAVLEADPVAQAVITVGVFTGTATELLQKLATVVTEVQTKAKGWPADAARLSSRLKRLAPGLRLLGIEVNWTRTGKTRGVEIKPGSVTSVTSVTPCSAGDAKVTLCDADPFAGDATGDGNRAQGDAVTPMTLFGSTSHPSAIEPDRHGEVDDVVPF